MNNENLNQFITSLSNCWGEVSSDLTCKSKLLLEQLAQNCQHEDWYVDLVANKPSAKQIYKSEQHGFILMAHVENSGDLSPPHDHGNGWVLYATVTGQVNMGIYHKIIQQDGTLKLVQKDAYPLMAGQCSVYLQGDIHDTHTVTDNTVMLRLTSCDFQQELEQGRLVRFSDNVDKWTACKVAS